MLVIGQFMCCVKGQPLTLNGSEIRYNPPIRFCGLREHVFFNAHRWPLRSIRISDLSLPIKKVGVNTSFELTSTSLETEEPI